MIVDTDTEVVRELIAMNSFESTDFLLDDEIVVERDRRSVDGTVVVVRKERLADREADVNSYSSDASNR